MHYCPESCREFLDETPIGGSAANAGRSFHYRSAPIYLLTLIVGLLFAADIAIGLLDETGVSHWSVYQTLGGFRLVLLAAVLGGARINGQGHATTSTLRAGRKPGRHSPVLILQPINVQTATPNTTGRNILA